MGRSEPLAVVDNGRRTFVVFPRNLSVMAAPMARMRVVANGPELINATFVDHVLVLDHLVPYALELRIGSGEHAEGWMRITRGAPTTLQCPGSPECPTWTDRLVGAVGRVAGRGPRATASERC